MSSPAERLPAHPFLVSIVPVWSLWSSNADQVDPRVALGVSGLALVGCALLLGVARALLPDWRRAGLATSLWLVIFYTSGFVADLTTGWVATGVCALVAIGGTWGLHRARGDLSNFAAVLTAGAAALLFYSSALLGLAAFEARGSGVEATGLAGPGIAAGAPAEQAGKLDPARPDIYYIVLDGYAGADVLQRVFGHDNRAFLDGLRSRGFVVAERSLANYAMTHLSLASVLNAAYLDALTRELGPESESFEAPYALLRSPWVARFLRARGYRFVQLMTNWGGTERSDVVDLELSYVPRWLRSEFTGTLLRATALRKLAPSVDGFHRFAFEAIAEVPKLAGPTFLFAHLLLPHEPYVFDAEGKLRADIPLHLRANAEWKEQAAAGRGDAAYVEQLRFLNGELTTLLDTLLRSSPEAPIIVIQGDHGWASHAAEPYSEAFVLARFPILNAFYGPPSLLARVYPSISSVNTFRLVLSELFGVELPLLPDRQYLSWYDAPYRLRDVSDVWSAREALRE